MSDNLAIAQHLLSSAANAVNHDETAKPFKVVAAFKVGEQTFLKGFDSESSAQKIQSG